MKVLIIFMIITFLFCCCRPQKKVIEWVNVYDEDDHYVSVIIVTAKGFTIDVNNQTVIHISIGPLQKQNR